MALFNKLVSGSAVNLIDHGLRIVVIFVTTPLMIQCLGEKTYGVWLLAVAMAAYLRLLDIGLSFAATRFMGRAIGAGDDDEYRSLVSQLGRMFNWLAVAVVASTGLLMFLVPLVAKEPESLSTIRLLVVGFGLVTALRFRFQVFELILKSHVRYDLMGWAAVARTLVQGVGVLGVLLAGYGLNGLLLIHFAAEFVYLGVIVHAARKLAPSTPTVAGARNTKKAWSLIRFGAGIVSIQAGNTLRSGIDPLIIARVSGIDVVPVYNVGTRFLVLFSDLMNTLFGGVIFAAFSQIEGSGDPQRLNDRFLAGCRLSSALACLGGGALLIFAPPFIERWVGSAFVDSGTVLLILVPGMILRIMQMPASGLLLSKAKHHLQAVLMLAGGALNLMLSLALASRIGFFGVVWATLIELVLLFGIAMPILVSRVTGIPLLVYGKVLMGGVVRFAGPVILCFFCGRLWLSPDYLVLALGAAVYGLIGTPVFWFSAMNATERRGILGMIHAKLGIRGIRD